MSLTSNKKKEIIQNLGKYRSTSDSTIKDFVKFTQELVVGLDKIKKEIEKDGNIDTVKIVESIGSVLPSLSHALDGATEYYESLSKYYVTALNEIANLKTDKNNE